MLILISTSGFLFCDREQFPPFIPQEMVISQLQPGEKKKKTQHKELFHLTFFFEKLMATQHHTKLVYKCNAMLSDVEIPKDCEILSKELLTCA